MGAERTLTPFFETSTKETFNYRELRANFHIVNSGELAVSLVDDHGQSAGDFAIELSYEGEVVHAASTKDVPPSGDFPGSPPAVAAAGLPPPPPVDAEGKIQPTPPPLIRLPISLLRGRNMMKIVALDSPDRFEFPMFFKTPARDWAESILKALIILVLIQFFVIQTFFIPTGSMKNTLMEKDFIMVEKVSYLFHPPERGDVVVFQYPDDPRKDFIKRMVAHEADRVEVSRKKLSINGHELEEPYVAFLDGDSRGEYVGRPGRPEKVPRFQYDRDFFGPHPVPDRNIFVMGDNRNNSLDSRMWGPLPLFRMKGKAFLVYWPLAHFGLIRHYREPFAHVDTPKPEHP